MNKNENVVMSTLKGSYEKGINFIPTKENVNYNRIYLFNNPKAVEKFNFHNENRFLKKSHIKEIIKDIESSPFHSKYFNPIRVDINTLSIADGQHRLSAFLKAWENGSKEVLRVIFEDYPKNDMINIVAKINSSNKNWTVSDYQHKLLVQGDDAMNQLERFGKEHTLTQKLNKDGEVVGCYPRYVYAIVFGKNITSDVKKSNVVIEEGQVEFAAKLHSELEQLVQALGYEVSSWFESFACAWYNIRKNDGAYSQIVDEIGIITIADNIKRYFDGFNIVTRKSEWEQRFRNALFDMKERFLKKLL